MENLSIGAAGAKKISVRRPSKLTGKRRREIFAFYLFVSPWIIVFGALGVIPLLWGLYISFTDFNGFNINDLHHVGFKNYHNVFTDPDAIYSLGRTLLITAIQVPIGIVFGFLLAVLLNQKLKGEAVFRTLIYLPSIIPVVATGLIFKVIFSKQNGIANTVLSYFGLPEVNFLGYNHITMSLVIMLLWGTGGSLIINLAGLKGISKDLYESASLEGATSSQRLRFITLPLMTPVIFFNLITALIYSLQLMIQPVLLTIDMRGFLTTPLRPNYVFLVHAFQQIFLYQRYAYGLALLWVLFVVILILTFILLKTSKYWVHYENDQEGK